MKEWICVSDIQRFWKWRCKNYFKRRHFKVTCEHTGRKSGRKYYGTTSRKGVRQSVSDTVWRSQRKRGVQSKLKRKAQAESQILTVRSTSGNHQPGRYRTRLKFLNLSMGQSFNFNRRHTLGFQRYCSLNLNLTITIPRQENQAIKCSFPNLKIKLIFTSSNFEIQLCDKIEMKKSERNLHVYGNARISTTTANKMKKKRRDLECRTNEQAEHVTCSSRSRRNRKKD